MAALGVCVLCLKPLLTNRRPEHLPLCDFHEDVVAGRRKGRRQTEEPEPEPLWMAAARCPDVDPGGRRDGRIVVRRRTSL